MKKAWELLKDATPFKMVATVSVCCCYIYALFWCLHGQVLRHGEGARALYNKVQAASRVPKLEKELEEAQLEWTKLLKERAA